jgi:hypothetical protein
VPWNSYLDPRLRPAGPQATSSLPPIGIVADVADAIAALGAQSNTAEELSRRVYGSGHLRWRWGGDHVTALDVGIRCGSELI